MAPDEAKSVAPKDVLIAEHTTPKWVPHIVKDIWVNDKGTLARFTFVKGKGVWVDASLWRKPPAGKVWDQKRGWILPTAGSLR